MGVALVLRTVCYHVGDLYDEYPETEYLFKETATAHPFLDGMVQLRDECVGEDQPLYRHLTPGMLSKEKADVDALCKDAVPYVYFAAALFLLTPFAFVGLAGYAYFRPAGATAIIL